MDTAKPDAVAARARKKSRVFTRPAGTFRTPQVSGLLLLGLARLGRCRLCGSSRSGSGRRSWRSRLCCCWSRWSRYSRLHVISIHHRLGDIHFVGVPPQQWTLRPRLRSVDDHRKVVVLGIGHDHRRHLLQNTGRDVLLLILDVFLKILVGAIEGLLLAFDLLLQGGRSVFVQLGSLSLELLL